MAIRRIQWIVTSSGSDGSATETEASRESPRIVTGKILAVHLDYSAGQAATTDVTLKTTETPQQTIVTKTDSATDAWYYPRVAATLNDGTGITYDGTNEVYDYYPVNDNLILELDQADNGETVTVTVYYEE